MPAVICTHAGCSRATSLMRIKKIVRATSAYNTYFLEHWNEENEITKTLNLIVIIFL